MSPWWAPCSGQEHAVDGAVRAAQVEQPAADGQQVLVATEVLVALEDLGRAGLGEDRAQLGIGLPEHECRARLDDPGLLGGDRPAPVADEVGVVGPDVRDDGDGAVGDVGGVVAAEHPDLDDGDVDGDLGEPAERGRRRQLEPARLDAGERGQLGELGEHLGELVVGDGLAVAADALVEAMEVRARVGTDRQTRLGHERRHHPGGRALAVRPGDVDDRVLPLRLVEDVDERAHPVERQPADGPRPRRGARLVVDVGVEPGQGVGEFHDDGVEDELAATASYCLDRAWARSRTEAAASSSRGRAASYASTTRGRAASYASITRGRAVPYASTTRG